MIYKASDVEHPRGSPSPSSPHGHSHQHGGEDCASHGLHLKRKEEEAKRRWADPEKWGSEKEESFRQQQHNSVIDGGEGGKRFKRQAEGQLFENLPEMPRMDEEVKQQKKKPKPANAKKVSLDSYGSELVDKSYWPFAQGQKTVTTYEIVDWADVPESVRHHFRKRANLRNGISGVDPKKKTCMLYLQADHLFYRKMGSEEASIDVMTRHVQRVNSIYRDIDFDGDGKPDNITFMIKRIKVYTEEALNEDSYRFPGNYGVEKFLEIFSGE